MTLDEQFATLAAMILMGAGIGVFFTVYQRFAVKNRLILLITDALFWIVQAFLVFAVLLPVNEGRIRLYLFFALALGFSMYQALFASLFLTILNRAIDLAARTGRLLRLTLRRLLINPLFVLLKLVFKMCSIILNGLLKCFLFPFILCLKFFRGVLHLVVPARWLRKCGRLADRLRESSGKWLSIIKKRK